MRVPDGVVFLWLVVAAGVTMACSRGNNAPEATPSAHVADSQTLTGTVALTGSMPAVMVTLRQSGGGSVDLTGDLRDELEALSGAEVAVTGERQGSSRSFSVGSYEVLSIDGQRPVVGILVERDGGLFVDGEESVRLSAPGAGLRENLGAKVWVVGRLQDGSLSLQSYGVIKSP